MGFDPFCGQSVVAVIMIDGSKTRKSLGGVEVQSPYVIERRSKENDNTFAVRRALPWPPNKLFFTS